MISACLRQFLSLMVWSLVVTAVAAEPTRQRIVFMGDSITDGNTMPLLVRQSIEASGRPAPVIINAGISGDMAKDMRLRVERDLLSRQPTLVALSVGINDVVRGVSNADYERDVRSVAEQLKAKNVPLMILTTTVLGPKNAESDKRLVDFNAILRRIAEEHGAKVAEVNRDSQAARQRGEQLLEVDDVHLSQAGYRVLARAVLDGLGYTDVPLVKEIKLELMPGVIEQWQMRASPENKPLDAAGVASLEPDSTWKSYRLPETEPRDHWWEEQERHRGFAQSLAKLLGPGKLYQGVTYLKRDQPTKVYFNTGGQLQSIWLNGEQVFKSSGWTGWHAGKERIPVTLQAGQNTVVIEAAGTFFLSVTDDNIW